MFDISKKDIIGDNKLLYWFHFLQTQVGSTSPILLVATKIDVLKKQFYLSFSFTKCVLEKNESKKKIDYDFVLTLKFFFFHLVLKKTINENGIKLNFHLFNTPFNDKEKLLFTSLNNREINQDTSGLKNLYSILSTEYDKVDHAVSTTLKHKIVFDKVVEISKRNLTLEKEITEKINPNKDSIQLDSKYEREVNEEEEPIVEVTDLLNFLNTKNDLNEIFERNELENILEDLHKLGLIVYFKKKSLSDTIISNPQWFNNVFKFILDFGRKNIEIIFETIYNKLKETNNKKMKEEFLKKLKWLKGDLNVEIGIKEIWNSKKKLKKSRLDKISFENILIDLDNLIRELVKQKESSIFEEIDEFKDFSSSSISQKFIFVDEDTLANQVINPVLKNYTMKGDKFFKPKKEFLMNILSQFDFVIPTKRLEYKLDGKILSKLRNYVVPLLFPCFKPFLSSTIFESKKRQFSQKKEENILESDSNDDIGSNWNNIEAEEDWNKILFENEWIVDYILPFKPSAVWKLLFMRIRGTCVGLNESKREMLGEIYWLNGFSFYMIENDPTQVKTFVELEFIEENKFFGQVLMKIIIKSNLLDVSLFFSLLHKTIQSFVKEWIVPEICNKIDITVTKKKENKQIESIQQYFVINEKLKLNESLLKNRGEDNNEDRENVIEKFKCFNCGFLISLLDLKDDACDKCKKKN